MIFPRKDAKEQRKTSGIEAALCALASAPQISSLPYFYFDCGTEDSLRNFSANRKLSELMYEKKISHEFRQLPGDHSWAYWDKQVREILKIAAEKMRLPRTMKTTRAARA